MMTEGQARADALTRFVLGALIEDATANRFF